jgi:hypothetical protein
MTMEEQRLSELLKRSVPEPPLELSADRVTAQHVDRSRRSWLMPVLAAAAVVLVTVAGVGLNATRNGSSTSPASSSVPQQAQVTSTAASATGQPAEAPASFNPLVLVNPWIGGPTGSSAELAVIGSAPDINGHPAKWLADGLGWEYANGGWATILTGGETAVRSAALQAELVKVASTLSWTPRHRSRSRTSSRRRCRRAGPWAM